MRRLVYLDSARDDLQKIFAYITRQSGNKVIGLNFVKLLREQCTKLAALPGSLGTSRRELQQDLRSFPFKAYVIFFRYRDDAVEVVNILEGHRDIDAIFR